MERYCPEATMLNYTNPIVLLCPAMQREPKLQLTGLCHNDPGTAEMLAEWCCARKCVISYLYHRFNLMVWYYKYKWKGQDTYPILRQAVTERPEVYNEEIVRNEMFLNLDYYVTESSGHNSEYNWWFRKRQDLIEKYCIHGTGWNPGEYAYSTKGYERRERRWRRSEERRV